MEIGLLIKQLRNQKGFTQEELAEKTELSARTIQRIENGEVDPRAYSLQMIAKALEVDYSVFVESESDEENEFKTDSERNQLAILHLSGLLLLFFPTIIIYNRIKTDVKGISKHYRDLIGFISNSWLIVIAGIWIFIMGHNPVVLLIGFIIATFQTIINTHRVLNGKPYKYYTILKFKEKNGKTKLSF